MQFSFLIALLLISAVSATHPIIYEISLRPWLYELSQKYGQTIKLRNIPTQEFQNLKNIGVEYVWLMGTPSSSA